MLLNCDEIARLLDQGVVKGGRADAINAASLDVHLGAKVLVELPTTHTLDYRAREHLVTREVVLPEGGYVLYPGEFILAHTEEVFHLPDWCSAEYKLKSSMARIGLEHMNAGWCDAGWHGSSLTLELKNLSQHHAIRLRPGDAIGQMIFFQHDAVPLERSYATRGRYNNDGQTAKGLKR